MQPRLGIVTMPLRCLTSKQFGITLEPGQKLLLFVMHYEYDADISRFQIDVGFLCTVDVSNSTPLYLACCLILFYPHVFVDCVQTATVKPSS